MQKVVPFSLQISKGSVGRVFPWRSDVVPGFHQPWSLEMADEGV